MEEIISPQIREILKTVDHTLLSPTATESEVRQLCRDGLRFRTASVCVAPAFVHMSRDFAEKTSRSVRSSDFRTATRPPRSNALKPQMPSETVPMRWTWW